MPFDNYHLEVAHSHYQELAFTSGLSLTQYAAAVARERGFLGDHECVDGADVLGCAARTDVSSLTSYAGTRSFNTSSVTSTEASRGGAVAFLGFPRADGRLRGSSAARRGGVGWSRRPWVLAYWGPRSPCCALYIRFMTRRSVLCITIRFVLRVSTRRARVDR